MNRTFAALAFAAAIPLAACGTATSATTAPARPAATAHATPRGPVTAADMKRALDCAEVVDPSTLGLDDLLPKPAEGFACVLPDSRRVLGLRARSEADALTLDTEFRDPTATDGQKFVTERRGVWLFVAQDSMGRFEADAAYTKAASK